MAHIWKDRTLEFSSSTGTGTFALAGPPNGFRAFSSVCSVNDTVYYYIETLDAYGMPAGDWETGLGTYSATNTLTRTTVLDSSNSGSAVNFGSGTKRVGLCAPSKTAAGISLISEVITSSSAASVTFSSIPGNFRDLEVRVRGRGTSASGWVGIQLQFNSDTGSNYKYAGWASNASGSSGGEGSSGTTSMRVGYIPDSSALSSAGGTVVAKIMDYRGTKFQKAVVSEALYMTGTGGTSYNQIKIGGAWISTSAITSVSVFPASNAFVDDSVVSLYGIF